MPGCLGCPSSDSTTILGVWTDFRDHYGPRLRNGDALYLEDLADYEEWAIEHGIPNYSTDYLTFKKWFAWRLTVGVNAYGNLGTRLRDHVGISAAKCPYDTNCNDIRATHMTGGVPANQNDHGNFYMAVEGRGSTWGFACTFSGCPYLADTGHDYFYV